MTARFHGNLDITTLGGAGFASQRTRGEGRTWDLSRHDGLEIVVDRADGKVYTLTLKDEILPKRPDGREQSTVSWEFDFRAERRTTIFVKWEDFRPTYRGKDKKDTEPLDLKNIKRFGIMVRRYAISNGFFDLLQTIGLLFGDLVSSVNRKALSSLISSLSRLYARSVTWMIPMMKTWISI